MHSSEREHGDKSNAMKSRSIEEENRNPLKFRFPPYFLPHFPPHDALLLWAEVLWASYLLPDVLGFLVQRCTFGMSVVDLVN